jgi:AraC-like DNA-binding protein
MLSDHSYQLLKQAAVESLERIQLDRAKAPQRLKPLLAYIEEHLFDPTLDVNQLKRACGVRDNSVPIQFHSAVGRPPHGYIEDRRLETACRLLANTDVKVWQISELLGYSSIQVFSRAFSRWSGQRPTLYRKKARKRSGGSRTYPALHNERRLFEPESLRQALAGELPPHEASALVERLLRLYPSCRESLHEAGAPGPSPGDDEGGGYHAPAPARARATVAASEAPLALRITHREIDRLRAEEIVRRLERLPMEEQLALVDDLRLSTPALFERLRERSREVSREDPRRGILLAELALKSLDVLERRLTDAKLLANLRARGWVALADARAVAADDRAAELAFAEAERYFRSGGREPETEAAIAWHKAALRREQKRFDDALALLNRALVLYRQLGREKLASKVLIAIAAVPQRLRAHMRG